MIIDYTAISIAVILSGAISTAAVKICGNKIPKWVEKKFDEIDKSYVELSKKHNTPLPECEMEHKHTSEKLKTSEDNLSYFYSKFSNLLQNIEGNIGGLKSEMVSLGKQFSKIEGQLDAKTEKLWSGLRETNSKFNDHENENSIFVGSTIAKLENLEKNIIQLEKRK